MSENRVAIVGSGPVGSTMAYYFTQKGFFVDVFEKGPQVPYPHTEQFNHETLYLHKNPDYELPNNLKNHTISGDYKGQIEKERLMVVGGTGTHWTAITPRMHPNDFNTKTLFDYGADWPISYEELEPYYCEAEAFIGVSGTDDDNPFAPWRSKPYPLPPFDLSYDDLILADKLKKAGIIIHTTPNARTRKPYMGRDACANFGTCTVCPMGARYSPNFHLQLAIETGLCKLHTNVSARRIAVDKSGMGRALVYSTNDDGQEIEHPAKIIIIAAGAIESSRLLLLSKDSQNPDGLGNTAGFVGKNFTFHHLVKADLHYKENLGIGRIGAPTGQTYQFINAETRGKHCAVKVEFSSNRKFSKVPTQWGSKSEILKEMASGVNWREIIFHAESDPSSKKYIELSSKRDVFGDPFAHIHYESSDLDYETYQFSKQILNRFVTATEADAVDFWSMDNYISGSHHMGGCKMSKSAKEGVVDTFGKIHGQPNLFVVGGSNFVGSSGAANPTLTMIALAIRSTEYIIDQLL